MVDLQHTNKTMNTKKRISVIIPVYNTEQYLKQCIQSVIEQNYSDFEIILVNDGSTDTSGEICDEYSKKDHRVKVIHSHNGGLSAARNQGIKIAQGDYMMFLDSDDCMAENLMEKAMIVLHNNPQVDMLSCTYYELYPDGKIQYVPLKDNPINKLNGAEEHFNYISKQEKSFLSACQNIFKSSVVKKHNLDFDENVTASEDLDFVIRFILHAQQFLISDIPIMYYRRNRHGSVTTALSAKAVLGMLSIAKKHYDYFAKDTHYNYMKYFFAKKFAKAIYRIHRCSKDGMDEVIDYIKMNHYILKDVSEYPYNITKPMWRIFGYYYGSKLIRKIKAMITLHRRKK